MWSISIIFLFTQFLVFSSCLSTNCPTKEEIFPCSCKTLANIMHVVCADFNSSSTLVNAFKVLRNHRITRALFHGLYFTDTLPNDLFDEMHIESLKVEKSRWQFSQPAFKALANSLSSLYIMQNSMITSKDGFALARLTKLSALNVQSNSLPKIKDTWLNGKVPNVHNLVLDENGISEVESNAFSQLKQLRIISLANNQIKALKRSTLPCPAAYLIKIDLSHNTIGMIPSDFFVNMPSLTEVILTGNELQTLPQATWTPVWENLQKVLLFNNKIVCDQNLDWIKRYRRVLQLEGDCVAPKERAGRPIRDMYYSR
ncbi:vasorin-like [Stegodyphus dumicola]|uniref:vasorin-like n=1 Tax=Stegodyphus dumicola TaxID=202533 RepID=UPI0015AD10E9|nr:vasorin-like [Stegodyphus dumicola]